MKALAYIEIDVDYCTLSYGIAPCTAAIGVTGSDKCFNTKRTCQDRTHFTRSTKTLRFSQKRVDYAPKEIDAIPSVLDISLSPGAISLGENVGQRSSLTVTFTDHPWPDTGPGMDKYFGERAYNPYNQGTFFGKFRARYPFVVGRALRVVRGYVGQALDEMEVRHYIIESFEGPIDGQFKVVAKDILKLADGDRAQAPRLSNGFLLADMPAAALTFTLRPVGIGNLEYPTSGYVAIGGNEIVSFTRVGDVMTVARGRLGTPISAHQRQDRAQLVLYYRGKDVADILYDLLVTYANVPASYISLPDWKAETRTYLNTIYTGVIGEPMGVNKLLSELIEQAALALVWDDAAQKLRLQVLKQIATDAAVITLNDRLSGSFKTKDNPDKRLTEVQTYYGMINPLESDSDPINFRSVEATKDVPSIEDFGTAAIKTVYSRWIPPFGTPAATRLNTILLSSRKMPPRTFNFSLMRNTFERPPVIGAGYQLNGPSLQDIYGAIAATPIIVTRINPRAERYEIEAEEALYASINNVDLRNRTLQINSDQYGINIADIHNTVYPPLVAGDTLNVIIETGITVGSNNASVPAITIGNLSPLATIIITVKGAVAGAGGMGGRGGYIVGTSATVLGGDGQAGGVAIYSRVPFKLNVTSTGHVWGGGGGGGGGGGSAGIATGVFAGVGFTMGGGGGGGGAGVVAGPRGLGYNTGNANTLGNNGQPGTYQTGGAGGTVQAIRDGVRAGVGGAGGSPGAAGANGVDAYSVQSFGYTSGGLGGAAGAAIDGIAYATLLTGTTNMLGPRI